MAPERHSHITPLRESLHNGSHSRRQETITALMPRITVVRIKVARFELISDTPFLPKIAVRPAKNADPMANHC